MTMPRTPDQLQQATREAEDWLDTLDPAATKAGDTTDLRSIAAAADTVYAAEARLRETVEIARAHGRSWGRIGMALGVSRQAARQRFSPLTDAQLAEDAT